jgi:hypothetical protein
MAVFNSSHGPGSTGQLNNPSAIAALANLNVKTAYIDGELCGVDDAGLPSFAYTEEADHLAAWYSGW